jgi:hypothetical protein
MVTGDRGKIVARNRRADGNPFRIEPPPSSGGQLERHQKIPEPTDAEDRSMRVWDRSWLNGVVFCAYRSRHTQNRQ